MNHFRFTVAALASTILMSGCIAYPVGDRYGDRGYSREGQRADCRDRADCDRREGDRHDRRDHDRDGDRRDDRGARP